MCTRYRPSYTRTLLVHKDDNRGNFLPDRVTVVTKTMDEQHCEIHLMYEPWYVISNLTEQKVLWVCLNFPPARAYQAGQ